MLFLLLHFVPKEPCSRPGDPDIALQSNLPRCLLSPTSNEVPNSQLCPDITGSFGITGNDADRGFSTSHTDGCFTTKTTTLGGLDSGASAYRTGIPYFVASRVSGIFGRSYGVSVDAVYALIIIKV